MEFELMVASMLGYSTRDNYCEMLLERYPKTKDLDIHIDKKVTRSIFTGKDYTTTKLTIEVSSLTYLKDIQSAFDENQLVIDLYDQEIIVYDDYLE